MNKTTFLPKRHLCLEFILRKCNKQNPSVDPANLDKSNVTRSNIHSEKEIKVEAASISSTKSKINEKNLTQRTIRTQHQYINQKDFISKVLKKNC